MISERGSLAAVAADWIEQRSGRPAGGVLTVMGTWCTELAGAVYALDRHGQQGDDQLLVIRRHDSGLSWESGPSSCHGPDDASATLEAREGCFGGRHLVVYRTPRVRYQEAGLESYLGVVAGFACRHVREFTFAVAGVREALVPDAGTGGFVFGSVGNSRVGVDLELQGVGSGGRETHLDWQFDW